MDAYAPSLIALGLRGMIGKGKRSPAVIESMKKHKAIYFGAIGGAAALISRCITAAELVCYEDLDAEAIRKLTVKDFPATVVIDTLGNNLYTIGVEKYLSEK
jgi:fumarate hydratase subunit beta